MVQRPYIDGEELACSYIRYAGRPEDQKERHFI